MPKIIKTTTLDGAAVEVSTVYTGHFFETVVFVLKSPERPHEEQFYGIFETPDRSYGVGNSGIVHDMSGSSIAAEVQQMTLDEMRQKMKERFAR